MRLYDIQQLPPRLSEISLIVFDLDGTLAKTKSVIDARMRALLIELLKAKQVAVIGGGKYTLFQEQLLSRLPKRDVLSNLFLFPTTATSFYRYRNGKWIKVYSLEFSAREKQEVLRAFRDVLRAVRYHPKKIYGSLIEDRGTQITFSALGQDVVKQLGARGVRMKEKWIKNNKPLKTTIARMLQKKLPKFEVHSAGFTSIDVTRKGIDKAYGIRQIQKYVKTPICEMVFIGDALFKGGNDYAARKTGVNCIAVKNPEDTKKIIRAILRAR